MNETPIGTPLPDERRRSGRLAGLLRPRSICVVGASERSATPSGMLVCNLLRNGLPGDLYLVNANRDVVSGVRAFRSVLDLPTVPDVAVLAIGRDRVPDAVRDCAAAGIGAAVVLSAGYDEAGEAGKQAGRKLQEIAERLDVRIIGPNCVGFIDGTLNVHAHFLELEEYAAPGGRTAVVSQSGALAASLYRLAVREGLAVNRLYSTGNELDISSAEVALALLDLPDVTAVLMLLESVKQPEQLLRAARRSRELGKALVVLKWGRSPQAQKAAVSHTGALAVDDDIFTVAVHAAGGIRVASMDEMVVAAKALTTTQTASGRRVGILSTSGGRGILLTDALHARDLSVPELSASLRKRLDALLPAYASSMNPVDTTAALLADTGQLDSVISELLSSDEIDLMAIAGPPPSLWGVFRDSLRRHEGAHNMPVLAWSDYPDVARTESEGGFATFTSVDQLAMAADVLSRPRRESRQAPQILDDARRTLVHTRSLSEMDSRERLAAIGVPFVASGVVTNAAEVRAGFLRWGPKIVLKLCADWLPHKSDFDAVRVGITTADEAVREFEELTQLGRRLGAAFDSDFQVLVQPMLPPGIELVIGAFIDSQFGPIVTAGLGGRLVEIMNIAAVATAPVSLMEARALVDGLAEGRLVAAGRGLSAQQRDTFASTLAAVSDEFARSSDMVELDVNPIIASADGLVAVDALVVVRQ